MKEHDYKAVGLRAGLEIHQQLNTSSKLFCRSPTDLQDTKNASYEFYRYLRPSKSEMGEIDRAALEEGVGTRLFTYKAYDSTCLVENDDEPPLEMNFEALKIALQIALLLHMCPFDQIHTMRKLVIDGSNTSGFQRTALVASDGYVTVGSGTVQIDTLSVEEEAAQIVDKDVYSLDRLGIPLVEIGTAPDITTPKMAREVALAIGTILRACKVKRGIGTIRQDINISIDGGARVEIKGVQALDLIEKIVRFEVARQINLLHVKDELQKRGARVDKPIEASSIFVNTAAHVLKRKHVWGVKLPRFAGILDKEIQPGRRLASELADHAKKRGVGGIFHTDELPGHGITVRETQALLRFFNAEASDTVVVLAHENVKTCVDAIYAVAERAEATILGIPEETRRALNPGTSEYMRPLPGAARMYPETDVSPIVVPTPLINRVRAHLPERLDDRMRRYQRDFRLNAELARQIAWSENSQLFEQAMGLWVADDGFDEREIKDAATFAVRTLEGTIAELKRDDVSVDKLTRQNLLDVFKLVSTRTVSKEGVPEILRCLAECPTKAANDAATELGLVMLNERELQTIVNDVVESRLDFIKAKGQGALGPLMGVVMKQVRGKADGKLVNEVLHAKIASVLGER